MATLEQFRQLFQQGLNNSEISRLTGLSEGTVRNRRKELGFPPSDAQGWRAGDRKGVPLTAVTPEVDTEDLLAKVKMDYDFGSGEGEFRDVIVEGELKSWDHIFEFMDLDPEEFEIADDTVRASVWQQSALDKNTGERSTVKLRSYRARFQKRVERSEIDLPALYASVATVQESLTVQPVTDRTTVVVWSDPQIGKTGSRGGTEELIARSVAKRRLVADELARRRPKGAILLDGGDGIEGFESGGNPMFTNDLSLTRQLDLYGTELMEWIKVILPYGRTKVVAVPSNHAAWRNGKQNLGNPGDDLGLFMHRQVKKITDAAGYSIEFIQSEEHDESVAVDVDGTVIGLVHGNQFGQGQAITWWEKQTFGSQAVSRADVLVTAHYHSFGAGVAGRNPHSSRQRWWLGAPTLDNGSDWYRSTAGRDSDPGVMIFDVTPDGFDLGSLAIL